MQDKAQLYRKVLNIFLLIAPFVDMLTSIGVRLGFSGMTVGMLVRFAFIAAMAGYVLFLYEGKFRLVMRLVVIATAVYGLLFLLNTARINGWGVVVENAKMFLKVYSFVYVLLGFFALYQQHGILISDKLLTIVFCTYTASIFLSAITNTSFHTYIHQEVGYCGWFYAGNEIGAIVAILSGVAMLYGFSKPKYLWVGILGLLAFSSTYIGTKVPFWAITAAGILLFCTGTIKWCAHRTKKRAFKVTKVAALLLCVLVLYNTNSPIQQNTELIKDRYETTVEDNLLDGSEDLMEKWKQKIFLTVDWLLSYRLTAAKDVIERFDQGDWTEKLFGIGYTFQIDGKERADVVEMDFLSIYLKQGVVGFVIFMAPLVYFAVVCIIALFKKLRRFWELESAFLYTYAILMGLACALMAGHVLVAPAVSIYIAICTVKLYAKLNEPEQLQTA